MAKIILYHGTSHAKANKIIAEGFKQKKSNWSGNNVSKKGFIYLTSAYSIHFANASAKPGDKIASIIQVEVDTADLYPDEDYIAWKFKFKNPDIDLEEHRHYGTESLKILGNVSVRLNTRITILGRKDFDIGEMMRYSDPVISPVNFAILGEYYKALTHKVFYGEDLGSLRTF